MSTAMADTVTLPTEVPAEGETRITLDRVVTDYFKNYRKKALEDDIQDLRASLKKQGQLQNCVGQWIVRDNVAMIATIAGFSRIEALRRNALQKVCDEYNNAMGKNAGDDGYIACGGKGFDSHAEREKIKEAGPEWAEKYLNALKNAEVLFKTIKVKDSMHAAYVNMDENEKRSDAPLGDKVSRIAELVADGAKQSDIAKGMGMTEPAVSHHLKIHQLPDHLIKVFSNLEAVKKGLNMNEGDAKAAQTRALGAVVEFIRRLDLKKSDPQAISFSHAREFSGEVLHKKDPLPLTAVYRILIDLTQVDDFGKPTTRSTVDWSVFKTKLADAKQAAKKLDEAPKAETPAAPAAGTTVETLAKEQQAEAAAATPAPAGEVSSGKGEVARATDKDAKAEIQAANAALESTGEAAAVAPAATSEEAEELEPDDSALEDLEADMAASDDGPANTAGKTPPPSAAAAKEGEEKPDDGSTRVKMTDAAPESRYKPRSPDKLEEQAISYLKDSVNDPLIAQCSNMMAAVALLDAAGMVKESTETHGVYVNFSVPVEDYYEALEKALEKADKKKFDELQKMKPQYTLPEFLSK